MALQNWIPSPLQMKKKAKGVHETQLEECANNTYLIPLLLGLQRQK